MISKKILLLGICTLNSLVMPLAATIDPMATEQAPAIKACEICTENRQEEEFSTLACGHTYCTECLEHIIDNAVAEHSSQSIRCPTCYQSISPINALNILSSTEKKSDYGDMLARELVRKEEHAKQCPTPDCNSLFINDSTCAAPFHCQQCNKEYCNQCLLTHAQEISCQQARAEKTEKEDQASNEWKAAHAKQCPQCKVAIEKNDGCNHMTCKQCRYEFCWICLERYPCPRGSYCPHPVPVHQPVQLTLHQRINRYINNYRAPLAVTLIWTGVACEAFAVYRLLEGASLRSDINRLRNFGTTIRSFNLRNIPHIQLPFFR